jgi:hypothetical protein
MTKLEHNFKLAIVLTMLCLSARGQNWTQTTTPSSIWYSMAGSQNGSNLVAAVLSYDPVSYSTPGQIYASTNGGQTWQLTSAPDNYWISVAASTDGMQLIAAAEYQPDFNPGQIFISTNGGLNWTVSSASTKNWQAVASSADGRILVGATFNDFIYVSTNSGADWFQSATNNDWKALAVSANGMKMYATTPGGIYISTNSGLTWNFSSTAPALSYSVVCSADGNQVVTGIVGGSAATAVGIYTSTDSGATWSQTSAPTNIFQNYQCLAMDVNGTFLLAGAYSSELRGQVYLSADGGSTWSPQNTPTNSWGSVYCSANGNILVAGEFGGSIYSAVNSQPTPRPRLTVSVIPNYSVISWPTSPAGFQLQTASILNPANWTNITNGITTSGTNYYFTNSLTAPSAFFRLEKP